MRYYCAWITGGLVAAVIIGCGPGKELPDDIPRVKEVEQPKKKIPTESDPVAKEIADRAIKAHTQGNSSLLAKGKTSKMAANGILKVPSESTGQFLDVPTSRTVVARWPNDLKLTLEYKANLTGTTTMILQGQFTWWGRGSTQNPNLSPQATEDIMRTDGLAQHWLPLLFPITEPKAVVFEPRKAVGTPPVDVIRVAIPARPVYQLSFDQTTGYLVRVEYTHSEMGMQFHKMWTFADHKPFDGLILPTKMEYTQTPTNGRGEVVQWWTVEKWEFPEKLDDDAFEPPK